MTSGSYPGRWFAPLTKGKDGWCGSYFYTQDVGDSTFQTPRVDSDVVNSFVAKIYKLLEDPASAPYSFWAPDGRSFMVRCVEEFCMSVLPEYFKHRSYAKFIMDLSIIGFRFRLADQMLAEFAREGFVRESSLVFQKDFGWKLKVHTPIPAQSPLPCFSLNCYGLTTPSIHKITYLMVDDPATDRLISWSPSGRSFMVRNEVEFCRDVLPKHFEYQSIYKFLIELCLQGFRFRRVSDSEYEFAKECFVRSEQPIMLVVLEEKAEIKQKMAKLVEKLKYVIRGLLQIPRGYLEYQPIMALLKGIRELKERIKEMDDPTSQDDTEEDSDMDAKFAEMLENCTEIRPDLRWIQQELQELNEELKRQDDLMECFLLFIGKFGASRRRLSAMKDGS